MPKLVLVVSCKKCPMPKRAHDHTKMICLDCGANVVLNIKNDTISDSCKHPDAPPLNDVTIFGTFVDCFKEAGLKIDSTQEYSVIGQIHQLLDGLDLIFKKKSQQYLSVNHSVATEKEN